MVYVVRKNDRQILNRCDAWEHDSEGKMRRWCRDNGWILADIEITMMGDMIMWVE